MIDKIVYIDHHHDKSFSIMTKLKYLLFHFFFKVNSHRNTKAFYSIALVIIRFINLSSILKFENKFFEKNEYTSDFPLIPKLLFGVEVLDDISQADLNTLLVLVYIYTLTMLLSIVFVLFTISYKISMNNSIIGRLCLNIISFSLLGYEYFFTLPICYLLTQIDLKNHLLQGILNILFLFTNCMVSYNIVKFNSISCFNLEDFFASKTNKYSVNLHTTTIIFMIMKKIYERNDVFLIINYFITAFTLFFLIIESFKNSIYNNNQTFTKTYLSCCFVLVERLVNSIISKINYERYSVEYKDYFIPGILTFFVSYIILTVVYFRKINEVSISFHDQEKFDLLEIKEVNLNKYIYKEPKKQGKALSKLKKNFGTFLIYIESILRIKKSKEDSNLLKLAGILLTHKEHCFNNSCPLNSNIAFYNLNNINLHSNNDNLEESHNVKNSSNTTHSLKIYNNNSTDKLIKKTGSEFSENNNLINNINNNFKLNNNTNTSNLLASKKQDISTILTTKINKNPINLHYLPINFQTSNPSREFYNDDVLLYHVVNELFLTYQKEFKSEFLFYSYFINFIIFYLGNYEMALIHIEKCKNTFYDMEKSFSHLEEFYLFALKELANDYLVIQSEFNKGNISEFITNNSSKLGNLVSSISGVSVANGSLAHQNGQFNYSHNRDCLGNILSNEIKHVNDIKIKNTENINYQPGNCSNLDKEAQNQNSFIPLLSNYKQNQIKNNNIPLDTSNSFYLNYMACISRDESGSKWSKTKTSPWTIVSMLNVLKYDQTFADLKKAILSAMEVKKKIWNCFKNQVVIAEDVLSFSKEYLHFQKQAINYWNLLNLESDNNPDSMVTNFYSRFMRDICNDKVTADKILESKFNPRMMSFNITNDELFNNRYKTDTGVVIVDNKDLSNPGIINYVNDTLSDFLDFKKKELLGNNIDIMIPNIIANVHSQLVKNYYLKGKSNFLGKTTSSLCVKNKQKYLIPVHFLTTTLPSFSNSVEGIALIRKKQQVEEIIICDYNGVIDSLTEDISNKLKLEYYKIQKNECSIFHHFPELLKLEKVPISRPLFEMLNNTLDNSSNINNIKQNIISISNHQNIINKENKLSSFNYGNISYHSSINKNNNNKTQAANISNNNPSLNKYDYTKQKKQTRNMNNSNNIFSDDSDNNMNNHQANYKKNVTLKSINSFNLKKNNNDNVNVNKDSFTFLIKVPKIFTFELFDFKKHEFKTDLLIPNEEYSLYSKNKKDDNKGLLGKMSSDKNNVNPNSRNNSNKNIQNNSNINNSYISNNNTSINIVNNINIYSKKSSNVNLNFNINPSPIINSNLNVINNINISSSPNVFTMKQSNTPNTPNTPYTPYNNIINNNSYINSNNNSLNNSRFVDINNNYRKKQFITIDDLNLDNMKNTFEESINKFFDLFINQIKTFKSQKCRVEVNPPQISSNFPHYNSSYHKQSTVIIKNNSNYNRSRKNSVLKPYNNKSTFDMNNNSVTYIKETRSINMNEFIFIFSQYSNFLYFSDNQLTSLLALYDDIKKYFEKKSKIEYFGSNKQYSMNSIITTNNLNYDTKLNNNLTNNHLIINENFDENINTSVSKKFSGNLHKYKKSYNNLDDDLSLQGNNYSKQSFYKNTKLNYKETNSINNIFNSSPPIKQVNDATKRQFDNLYYERKELNLNHLGVELMLTNTKIRIFSISKEYLFDSKEENNSAKLNDDNDINLNMKNNIKGEENISNEKSNNNRDNNDIYNYKNEFGDTASISNNKSNLLKDFDISKLKTKNPNQIKHKLLGLFLGVIILFSCLSCIILAINLKSYTKDYLELFDIVNSRNRNLMQIGRLSKIKYGELVLLKDFYNVTYANLYSLNDNSNKFTKELVIADEDMINRVNTNSLLRKYALELLNTQKYMFSKDNSLVSQMLENLIDKNIEELKLGNNTSSYGSDGTIKYELKDAISMFNYSIHESDENFYSYLNYINPFLETYYNKYHQKLRFSEFNLIYQMAYNTLSCLDLLERQVDYFYTNTHKNKNSVLNNNTDYLSSNEEDRMLSINIDEAFSDTTVYKNINKLYAFLQENIDNYLTLSYNLNNNEIKSIVEMQEEYISRITRIFIYMLIFTILFSLIILICGFFIFKYKKDKHTQMLLIFNCLSNPEIEVIMLQIRNFELKYLKYFLQLEDYKKKKISFNNDNRSSFNHNSRYSSLNNMKNEFKDDSRNDFIENIRKMSYLTNGEMNDDDSLLGNSFTNNFDDDMDNNEIIIENKDIINKGMNNNLKLKNDKVIGVGNSEYKSITSRNKKSIINRNNIVSSYVMSVLGIVVYIFVYEIMQFILINDSFKRLRNIATINELYSINQEKIIYLADYVDDVYKSTFVYKGKSFILQNQELYQAKNQISSDKISLLNKLTNATYNSFLTYTDNIDEHSNLFYSNITDIIENEICDSEKLNTTVLCQNIDYILTLCKSQTSDNCETQVNDLNFIQKKGIKSIFAYYTETILEANSILTKNIRTAIIGKSNIQTDLRPFTLFFAYIEKIIKPRFLVEVLVELLEVINDNFISKTNSQMDLSVNIISILSCLLSAFFFMIIFINLNAFMKILYDERRLSNQLIFEIPDFILANNNKLSDEIIRIHELHKKNTQTKRENNIGGRKIEIASVIKDDEYE